MAGYPGGRFFERRWWTRENDDLGKTVWAIGEGLSSDQAWRRNRDRESLVLYEGRNLSGMHAGAYTLENQYQDYNLNITRAACDTVHAEIAGRQKPIGKFQTSGGDWKTQRRAKKLEKFCIGVLNQKQGCYLTGWQLMEDAFLDSAIWGVGVAKVFWQNGRVNIERHFDHELYVDPVEARYGDPKNLFHVYTMERDMAIWKFAQDPALKLSKKRRKELTDRINGAEEVDPEVYGNNPRVAKAIKVVEAWRLAHPDGTPGRHVFAINNALLLDEEWNRDSFPFVRMFWERDRMGWHGKGLVEQGETIHRELNTNAVRLQERLRLCASKRTFVEDESVQMEDMQANDAEVIIRVRKGAKFPEETVPKPIAEAELRWMNEVYDRYWQMTGVSQMRATSQKEPGVTAGVAMRTLNDMQVARFSLKAKGYENGYVDLNQQIILCCREAAQTEDVKIRYDEEIDWKEVELPENTFEITIAPASSLPNDPAGRLQMAQELFELQIIGPETFKQLLGWPDLEKHMGFQASQRNYLEKIIDRMLDEDDLEYIAPDPFLLDKPGAVIQVAQAYFEALYDGAPEDKLERLRQYMSDLDALVAIATSIEGQIIPGAPGDGTAALGDAGPPAPPPETGDMPDAAE